MLAYGRLGRAGVQVLFMGLIIGAVAGLWSLLAVPVVIVQASTLAGGAPFCIAVKSKGERVASLWDLRGFSFYSFAGENGMGGQGAHDTYRFHRLLIVDAHNGRRLYTWSPGRLRFDRINWVRNECTPIHDYWRQTLGLPLP